VTATLDRIRASLVGLRMPCALEALDDMLRRLERGELSALQAIDGLLAQEHVTRESRRIGVALKTARLMPPKTIESFDFSFQSSLDRNRILALAELDFVARAEVVPFLGPPGTGKSHLASALGVAAVKAGWNVYRCSLAELVEALRQAEREGRLLDKIRYLSRNALLIVDEIGYLPITPGGSNLFFQLVNARYEKGAFAMGLGPMAAPWLTPHLEPWLRRVGRGLRRSRRRHRAARPPPAPRRRRADRGRQLPPARAGRPDPRAHPRSRRHRPAAAAQTTRPAPQDQERRSLEPRLIAGPPNRGLLPRRSWGNFSRR
jgi:DNA replication protein DnaC